VYSVKIEKKQGKLKFKYQVDSEKDYDFLEFYINKNLIFKTSESFGDLEFEKVLEKGFYILEWIYVKDSTNSKGKDRAWIKDLEIHGTKTHETSCTKCPFGTFSNNEKTSSKFTIINQKYAKNVQ
jgi:hypothetical protein